jgi:hypothetical protein
MKNNMIAMLIGLLVGLIDLIPLVLVGAPLLNMLSIVTFWIITAVFIANITFFKNALINGLMISIMNMLPLVMVIYTINPKDFLPMLSMAVLLGPLAGYLNKRFIKR